MIFPAAGGPRFRAAQDHALRFSGCRTLRFVKAADFDFMHVKLTHPKRASMFKP
jgi:hypothetical protein